MDLHSFRGSIKNDVFLQPDNKFNINHSKIQYLKAIIIEKLAESFGAIHALELMVKCPSIERTLRYETQLDRDIHPMASSDWLKTI